MFHMSKNIFTDSLKIFTNLFSEKISSTEKKISTVIYFMFKKGPLRLENTPKCYNLRGGPGGSTEVQETQVLFGRLSKRPLGQDTRGNKRPKMRSPKKVGTSNVGQADGTGSDGNS